MKMSRTMSDSSILGSASENSHSFSSISNKKTPTKTNNTLSNLNSVKSEKFQTHTRKLLEIALEMLLKCQVPSVQYISLTTINRIFDIYVYHSLFYPGFYESCYVPLAKRQLNRQEQQQSLLAAGRSAQRQKSVDEACVVAGGSLKLPGARRCCGCAVPSGGRAKQRFSGKRVIVECRSSTIREDPLDEEDCGAETIEESTAFPEVL